jgi:glycyl-tRNA synthetase
MTQNQNDTVSKIVSLCKRRGIIFQNSEIYGGIQGFYDYGPIGVLMKQNWKNLWWQENITRRRDVQGIDGSIITHPKVWEASGHIKNFADTEDGKKFNIMFETQVGVKKGETQKTYLRGEACQNIYLNFKNVLDSVRIKIPFGIAQIGKAFRNEITPKNFIYRTREFEQWDIQFFVKPKDEEFWFDYWKKNRLEFYKTFFNNDNNLRLRQHEKNELVFYAKDAFDIEYNTPWGWAEMEGIHNRGDYDLKQHSQYSHTDLQYQDLETNEKYLPHIIECSGGVDRSFFYLLCDAYTEEKLDKGDTRTVLKIHPKLSAYKMCIIPLAANKTELVDLAEQIYSKLYTKYSIDFDDSSNIGKKYRRQDEIGTPWCLVVDYQTLEDQTVSIRDRDTMTQIRLKIDEVDNWLFTELNK